MNEWYCVVVVFDNDAKKMEDVKKLEISLFMKRPGETEPRKYDTLLAVANIGNQQQVLYHSYGFDHQ